MKSVYRSLLVCTVLGLLSACGFRTIDTGNVGIPVSFGQITGEPVTEGLHFYNPFTSSIKELDTHVLKWETEVSSYTKDVQEAKVKFDITYQLRRTAAASVYKLYGDKWADTILPQNVNGILKDVVGRWDAVDLVQNREKAAEQIRQALTKALAANNVDLIGFQLVNIDYSDQFNHSIEAKVIAQQDAIRELNHTEQIKQTAAQQVISAQAEAQSMSIRAQALEKNAKLVEWEAVQKWDGKLPQYQMSGVTPFINLGR